MIKILGRKIKPNNKCVACGSYGYDELTKDKVRDKEIYLTLLENWGD